MIRINLLPVREWRRREAVRQQISIFLLSLLLLLAILLGSGITIQGKLQGVRDEYHALKQQKQKLAYVDSKIAKLKKKAKEVEAKFRAIETLQTGRTLTTRVMDEVVTALPIDRVWLKGLHLGGNSLQLSGVALDNHTVALFMRRLEASPLFKAVTLQNTRRQVYEGQELMDFKLTINITPPKPAGEKGKKA